MRTDFLRRSPRRPAGARPRLLQRAALVVATAGALLGGALAVAPTASAVGSSACTHNDYPQDFKTTTAVNFRTGPSTSYTSTGQLQKGTVVHTACSKGKTWAYVNVASGAHKKEWGWVSWSYLKYYRG